MGKRMEVSTVCASRGSAPGLIGWWRWDLVSNRATWSPEMFVIFGIDESTFDGDLDAVYRRCVHPEDISAVCAASEKVLLAGEPTPMEYRIVLPDGQIRTVWAQGDIQYDETGAPASVLGYVLEIGAYHTYRNGEARYRLLFETMAQGVVFQDGAGRITSANPAAQRILGLDLDELTSRTSLDEEWGAVGEDGAPLDGIEHPSMIALRTGAPVHDFVMGIRTPTSDERVWIEVDSVPRLDVETGVPVEVCTTFTDITARKRAEGEARRRAELAEGLAQATSSLLSRATLSDEDILAVLLGLGVGADVERAYVFEHRDGVDGGRGTFSLRYSWTRGRGARVADDPRTQGLSWDDYAPRWHDTFIAGGYIEGRVADLPAIERRALAEHRPTSVLELPIMCGARFWGYIGFDVTGEVRDWLPDEIDRLRKAAHCIGTAMELREQAMCDPLTGLFNRRYLEDTLQREIARAMREKATTGVVCLDIDYFKEVNDRFGHAVGDQVLKGLAEHLREMCREGDVVCRIGGDEFLVVLPHTDLATAHECAQRWIDSVREVSRGWTCVGEEITVSAGVSAIDGPESERIAITRADHALLQAKATGRNRVEVAAGA
jgi:diguanylate cyclase (GGDEF)-like protein/PAS domain S-box-containing protein